MLVLKVKSDIFLNSPELKKIFPAIQLESSDYTEAVRLALGKEKKIYVEIEFDNSEESIVSAISSFNELSSFEPVAAGFVFVYTERVNPNMLAFNNLLQRITNNTRARILLEHNEVVSRDFVVNAVRQNIGKRALGCFDAKLSGVSFSGTQEEYVKGQSWFEYFKNAVHMVKVTPVEDYSDSYSSKYIEFFEWLQSKKLLALLDYSKMSSLEVFTEWQQQIKI